MLQEDKTEVLVVGAGPVGMLTALLLADGGIEVKIIDQEWRTAAHSYACALHPRTLELLDRLALATDVLKLGHGVDTVAFYEGQSRHAELILSELPVEYPYVLVLPQRAVEELLEENLKHRFNLKVNWCHRLTEVHTEGETAVATIDKLAETSKGYIIPEWDWAVAKTLQTRADFVVGADGHNSHVRQCLGIEYEPFGAPQFFVVYEFEAAGKLPHEMRVVIDHSTTNVFWPLTDNRCRWSFQVIPSPGANEFPEKERESIRIIEPAVDHHTEEHIHRMLHQRAPWFETKVKEIDWAIGVQFERRLARQFGQQRCWLVGDAAHQTGPVGMQSMNVGLAEADELARKLIRILRQDGPLDLLANYNQDRKNQWERLLGISGKMSASDDANLWVKEHSAQIPPCIPASGEDLDGLLKQLGLELPSRCNQRL